MSRLTLCLACAVLGLAMLVCGLMVPAHLRAVDTGVIEKAGRNTPGVVERGLALANQKNLGAGRLLLEAAQLEQIGNQGKLRYALDTLARQNPELQVWGSPAPLPLSSTAGPAGEGSRTEPVTDFVIRLENRENVLAHLAASPRPEVQQLLRFRKVTNTTLFPPSQSASGQPLDAALAICGLLMENGRLTPGLNRSVSAMAAQAVGGGNTQSFEQVLMDVLSLGQRFDWGQLTAFVGSINDPETMRVLTNPVRKAGNQLPVLFAVVELSDDAAGVSRYLMNFSQSGLSDLGASLRFGAGGLRELLSRNQRLHVPKIPSGLGAGYGLRAPRVALAVKWILYLMSGFLLAAAVHFGRAPATPLEQPLQVRGFHVARELLFALGFLFVVLLLSEPFLAQESQKAVFPFRLRLPTTGSAVPAGTSSVHTSLMSQSNMLTLLLFFALQGLLYTASIFKLAEIRRQKVPSRMKLKLLENEDHLFDAGLYLGFLGTIVSFIIFSLGVVKEFSLMVAYSSTSFGIIFVSVFKILHLRPARRRLLLEAEAAGSAPAPRGTVEPQALAVHL